MEEIWKYIPGFDNAYQVSNLGRVKSMNYNHTGKEKLRKLDLKKTGYQQVELFKNRKERGSELVISRITLILGLSFFIICLVSMFI